MEGILDFSDKAAEMDSVCVRLLGRFWGTLKGCPGNRLWLTPGMMCAVTEMELGQWFAGTCFGCS